MPADRFRIELRAGLLDAASSRRHHPRRRRRLAALAGAAAVLAAVVVASTFAFDRAPTAADVRVLVDGDTLVIELRGRSVDAEEVRTAAQQVGLDVTVEEVPVGPSNVGRFVGYSGSELPPTAEPVGDNKLSFTAFRIPRGWPGTLVLKLGRPAEPGEAWVIPSNALAPGEPAECLDLLDTPVADAQQILEGEGIDARWFMLSTGSTIEVEPGDLDDYRDWRVVQVEAIGDDDVYVHSTEDGSWPFPPQVPRPRPSPDC